MSGVLAPFGMRPLFAKGQAYAQRFLNTIPTGHAFNLFKHAPVLMATDGTIQPAANAGDMIGVFAGIEYPDVTGKPTFSNNWVSGTVIGTTYGPTWAFVWTDPDMVYEVQFNGPVPQAALGDQANFSAIALQTPTDGSLLTGLSTMAASLTLAGAGVQGMLRIYDFQPRPDNDWNDLFTIMQVQVARHIYVANKLAI